MMVLYQKLRFCSFFVCDDFGRPDVTNVPRMHLYPSEIICSLLSLSIFNLIQQKNNQTIKEILY